MPETICLAFTGASGMPYGVRLLECLLAADCRVQLLYSQVAQIVAKQEMGLDLPARASDAQATLQERYRALPGRLEVYGREEWFAPVASGSNPPDAMVVCPCSMGTLAAIAQGLASKLIERAADVVLKENRKLILVPRETPLSAIHLENMLRLVRAGAVILPPNPGFYHHPQCVEDMVDFVVARILDQLRVAHTLIPALGRRRRRMSAGVVAEQVRLARPWKCGDMAPVPGLTPDDVAQITALRATGAAQGRHSRAPATAIRPRRNTRQRCHLLAAYLLPARGVKRACSAAFPARVIETTTFMSGDDAYLALPCMRLSPSAVSVAVLFSLPARMVAVPVAPAVAILAPAWSVTCTTTALSLASLLSPATTSSKW
jgi:4-hydroxy-3-polyprenylbenzoate decarboxylase